MNKISKKIVALVTMAAFVLTLVPFAAFAAEASTVQTAEKDYTVTMSAEKDSKATISATVDVVGNDANHAIYVWLTDENGYYRYAKVVTGGADGQSSTNVVAGENGFVGAAKLGKANASVGKHTFVFEVSKAGKYTVHAGVDLATGASTVNDLTPIGAASGYSNEVTVNAAASHVEEVTLTDTSVTIAQPNGIKTADATVKVKSVYDAASSVDASSEGKVVAIQTNNSGIHIVDPATSTEVTELTMGSDGTKAFKVLVDAGVKAGTYKVYFTVDNKTGILTVNITDGSQVAQTIEKVETSTSYVKTGTQNLTDAVQFVVKDANGNALDAAALGTAKEGIVSDKTNTISIVKQPKGAGLTANDITVADVKGSSNKYLTLTTTSGLNTVGDYTIRLALNNTKSIDVSFTVANPGKTVDLVIDMNDATINKNGQVALGKDAVSSAYAGAVYFVDANGIKTKATSVAMGYSGAAVNSTSTFTGGDISLVLKQMTDENKTELVGSKITITAVDTVNGLTATKELTAIDPSNTEAVGLEFDTDKGEIGKTNTVNVSVVKEDGSLADVDGTIYAYVADKSVEDANVEMNPVSAGKVTDGKGQITLYSDKETTADVVVAVIEDGTNKIYGGTLSYAFGEQDVPVDTSVVMTIGSNDLIVNNDVVTVEDAAPYVANDRTYVPFRALGEALGAEVVWDNDARTVTYTLGKTEVVMTIGEKTYTVNGEEKTMDVAPEITNDRTYVPVRFVGEALGFKVTALSAADGTTASVVFQK